MFLADPARRLIAGRTDEVLHDQVWRYHTDAQDGTGELAQHLHKIVLEFNDTCELLDRLLVRVSAVVRNYELELKTYGLIATPSASHLMMDLTAQLARQAVLADVLTNAYHAWRLHHPADPDADQRHLLVQPRDPSAGVLSLRRIAVGRWHVVPDEQAAAQAGVPYAGRLIGEVAISGDRWQPIAYTSASAPKAMTYRLQADEDLRIASRALLRWWKLRHSAQWHSRRPDQLTDDELTELTE